MANYSRQRELIERELLSTKEHPSAAMLYSRVRRALPNISLGTVYRNLKFLQDEGRVVRIPANQSEERFDGNVSPHPHFVCDICGAVSDAEVSAETDALIRAGRKDAQEYSLVYFGVCSKCLQNGASRDNK